MTPEPPPQKRHGSPLTEWGLQNHFKLMDLRDCPHNYITAFQQAFELHPYSSGTPQHFIHGSTVECAMTDMALLGALNKVELHGTGDPLIPLRTRAQI